MMILCVTPVIRPSRETDSPTFSSVTHEEPSLEAGGAFL
jgi:hypothetical protein